MKIFLPMVLVSIFIFQIMNATLVGSAYIYAPAVLTSVNKGSLTIFYLNVTTGNGNISISGPSSVGSSTLQSAEEGAAYACSYLGLNKSDYNFYYTISDKNVSVSGPSGGLAFTLDAISALSHKPLLHDFTLTGTINLDGTVGPIGGIYDKVAAAKQHGLVFMLVPHVENGSMQDLIYYLAQQTFNIPLVEVANVSQAMQFATGASSPTWLNYSIYSNYYVNELPYANLTCENCYLGSFQNLTSFTFNFTNNTIENIPNNYYGAKSVFEKDMSEYASIAQKGYLYTAADFSFLLFPQAFMLEHSSNVTNASASSLISNVSSFCSSLVPPQLTNTNYEYVIGGELRQEFGSITAGNAATMLNESETSDGILESIYTAGEAYGWCLAAQDMYSIASNMSGRPVISSGLEPYASELINSASKYGSNLYSQSALNFYNEGNYPAAIYSATYAKIFGNSVMPNYNASQYLAIESKLIGNSTYGIWPNQFAKSSQFYMQEYYITKNLSDLQAAYSLALLASNLSSANKLISNSFVYANASTSSLQCTGISSQVTELSNQVQQIYSILFVMVIILFAILVILLVYLIKLPCQTVQKIAENKNIIKKASNKRR